jgi:hypothetical protein
METFATPWTPRSFGRMVHRARTDISIGDTVADESRIIMIRLVDESGWSMWRRRRDVRQPGCLRQRSCTTCRARRRSVPDRRSARSTRDRGSMRAHRIEPRDARQQILLQRDGDQLLDLRSGEPESLGLHLHRGRAELGKGVDATRATAEPTQDETPLPRRRRRGEASGWTR